MIIYYEHRDCPVDPGVSWEDRWSCACNSPCPACGAREIEPVSWEGDEGKETDEQPS